MTTDAEIEALRQAMKEHMEWEQEQWMKEMFGFETNEYAQAKPGAA